MEGILAHHQWASLALDLAIMQVPGSPIKDFEQVYEAYNIDEEELKRILQVPEFQQMFRNELDRCRANGTRASQIYRFTTLSQALSEKLYTDAANGQLEPKDAIKLLELLMKAAGIAEEKSAQVNTQVNVGLSLPLPSGLKNKKLAHLEEAPSV